MYAPWKPQAVPSVALSLGHLNVGCSCVCLGPVCLQLVNFLSSGPVVAMVWEGKEVVKYGRTMIGATNPLASAPGTIRGDFGIDVGRNIVHGSDSIEVGVDSGGCHNTMPRW